MKLIYGEDFTEEEKRQAVPTIFSNVIQAIKMLGEQAITLNLEGKIVAKEAFEVVRNLD